MEVSALAIVITLEKTLVENGITKNALAREARVRPNLIYDMCDGKTRRLDLDTLGTIIDTLSEMTGKSFTLNDVLAYQENSGGARFERGIRIYRDNHNPFQK